MAGERPAQVRERHGGTPMNESPVLGGIHRVEDIDAADDFSKKHAPYVTHPNLPDHWIDYLEIYAKDAAIATYNFAAGVVAPKITAVAMLDPGTKVMVSARCNLHGVWVAETTV
jgi:hypothetical protein